MLRLVEQLDQRLYPECEANWDDVLFREKIMAYIRPDFTILDLGAGAGIVKQMNFRGLVRKVCGVDLDPRVLKNSMLDESRISDVGAIPYRNDKFDLVFADNVLEHLAEPAAVFREVARVLKPAGIFLFKTPNKRHYVPVIARLTPNRFHRIINQWRGRQTADTFPTLYRANTKRDLKNLAVASNFTVLIVDHIEKRPEYLRLSIPTYLVGATYERIVNATSLLAPFRLVLIGALQKA